MENRFTVLVATLIVITVIGYFDYLTPVDLSFSLFYLIPISLLALHQNTKIAITLITTVFATIVCFLAEYYSRQGSSLFYPIWNSVVRLFIFASTVILIWYLKESKESFRKSEIRFKTLFEDAILGFALIDSLSGKIYEVNSMFCKIAGRSVKEMMNIDIISITHPDDIQYDLDKMALFVRGEINGFQMEKRYIRPDGSIVWIQMTISRFIKEEGMPLRHICMIEDISNAKERETNLLLKSKIIDKMAEGVVLSKVDNNIIVYANPALESMLGYNQGELIGKHISILNATTNMSPREIADDITKALNQSGYWRGEIQNIKKNGEIIWSRALVSPLEFSEFGSVWISVNENITERKISDKLLSESEDRYKLVISASEEGIFDADLENNTTYFSPRWLEIMGCTDAEMKQNREDMLKFWISKIHPDDLENALVSRKASLEGIKPYNVEYRIIKGDEIFWLRSTGKSVNNSNGKPKRFVGSILDITDRKKAEIELIMAKEKAQESDRLKSAFLANMSHEIRTPMNGILGFADLLKSPNLSGEEAKDYISMINQSGARMLNIINDIIDISKIESGQMKIEIVESNINKQIEYIYTFFKPEAEAKGIQLSVQNSLPSRESTINTDREKVFAIFTNLMKNAIKFTDQGSVELGYHLRLDSGENQGTDQVDHELVFFVKDSGIGIAKDRQTAIFERFIQAEIDNKRAYQGAGLGLAITKSYVEMLGGRIWVESEQSKGSTFYFTLPYNPGKPSKNNIGNAESKESSISNIKKLKILIAEDDNVSTRLLSISLKLLAKELLKVTNGNDAVKTCYENPDIDLILMDIQMPVLNGFEAVRKIRQFNKDVFIIAQTAYGLTGDREKAIQAGCNEYMSKPINFVALKEMIQKYFPD